MNRYSKYLILLLSFALLSCNKNKPVTSSESSEFTSETTSNEESSSSSENTSLPTDNLDIEINLSSSVYEFHSEKQLAYLLDDYTNIRNYADGLYEYSRPVSFEIDWSTSGNPLGNFNNFNFYLYENEIDDDNLTIYSRVAPHISLLNLKMNTKYYLQVEAVYSLASYYSSIQTFETTDIGPRNLYIEGVKNARDIGGYQTIDGKTVKQGLIYRTARLNKSETLYVKQEITEYGIDVMLNTLKIKTEIDLRHNWLSGGAYETGGLTDTSLLGETVNYYQCPLNYSSSDILSLNKEMFQTIFTLLTNESNYPLFYHCDIGTDRTGLLTVYLLGMVGVTLDDIYRDYLFSNFANIGSERSISDIASNINFISSHDGNSFKEKVIATLVESGITSTQIDTITNILLEGGNK
ncbi:MAG: tyrosine-protein phosphatase [Bacilli bacterium]